jgi:hypothetical protein
MLIEKYLTLQLDNTYLFLSRNFCLFWLGSSPTLDEEALLATVTLSGLVTCVSETALLAPDPDT